jgi:hypothetical protein
MGGVEYRSKTYRTKKNCYFCYPFLYNYSHWILLNGLQKRKIKLVLIKKKKLGIEITIKKNPYFIKVLNFLFY